MTKQEFDRALQRIRLDHPDYRPFQCPGHPFDARLFIVGHNPATPGLPDWWSFWHPDLGFDFRRFEEANKIRRQGKFSETRVRLNHLREGLGTDISWVETNLYPIASRDKKAMPKVGRDSRHLDLLLETCSPQVVFVHGAEPRKYFAKKMGLSLPALTHGVYAGPIEWPGRRIILFYSNQLAFGPGRENMRVLGQRIYRDYLVV